MNSRRSLDQLLINNDDLLRKRRRYELLRGLLIVLLVVVTLALLTLGLVAQNQANETRSRVEELLRQQSKVLAAQEVAAQARQEETERQALETRRQIEATSKAINYILTKQQAQLDEMDRRNLARLQIILDSLRAIKLRIPLPQQTLAPTPQRTASVTACNQKGNSGKCR